METVIDLKDLLKHEIIDLYSAEEQIIEALPLMIEKAGNDKLKAALKDHLKVTKDQKSRLDEIQQMLGEAPANENEGDKQNPSFFSRLFGNASEKCKGMEGLISEGTKMMSSDMSPQAADAAIIASAQKIEHYEISGYGTARAYARELKLNDVAAKLEQTLNEEYQADDLLTQLAVGKVNIEAQLADGSENGSQAKAAQSKSPQAKSNGKSGGGSAGTKSNKKSGAAKSSSGKSNSSKSASGSSASKSSASKNSNSPRKGSASRAGSSKAPTKSKTASKKGPAKSSKGRSSKSSSKNKSSRGR